MVFCENDANCAALCEHEWGAGRGIDDFVMVTLGTGIGGGVIADGQLIRGHSGFAGEIGHMVVVARGAACHCGGHGCWERYASGGGLNRLTREAAIEGRLPTLVAQRGNAAAVRAEDVTAAAAQNLDEAVVLMKEIGWWLALGLANLAAILDCGHFVIGGGLSIASDLVLPSAREYLVDLVEGYRARPAITRHAVDVRTALRRDGRGARGLRAHVVKLGVLLPTFRNGAADALAFADRAVEAGLDGLFAYDHLWPMGSPTRPSLAPFPVARGRRAAPPGRHRRTTRRARRSRGHVAPRRAVPDARTRRALARDLRARSGRQTFGGRERGLRRTGAQRRRTPGADGRDRARALRDRDARLVRRRERRDESCGARDVGATINLWDAAPERVARDGDVGRGELGRTARRRTSRRRWSAIRDAGATWAVFAPDVDVEALRQWRDEHAE